MASPGAFEPAIVGHDPTPSKQTLKDREADSLRRQLVEAKADAARARADADRARAELDPEMVAQHFSVRVMMFAVVT
jgi:hypothetical protein